MRREDINRFYKLLNKLADNFPHRKLSECNGRMWWPKQGVYFFLENGELRENSDKLRVVRVGTHAVSKNSKTTLWSRLRHHKGKIDGGGNHRGSIFRKLIGQAIINKNNLENYPNWNDGRGNHEIRESERQLEEEVSKIIGKMPFLYLAVPGESASDNMRAFIETNSIALLSNKDKVPVDEQSLNWLGMHTGHNDVIDSGLWNSRDVNKDYDPKFLDVLAKLINDMIQEYGEAEN